MLIGLAAANLLGLALWAATADLWHRPRWRGLAIGGLITVPYVALLFGVWPWAARGLGLADNPWTKLVVSALIQAVIGSMVYIRGVPRPFNREARRNPDARNEKRSPLEFTADDGDLLCDVIDLSFGSTRPQFDEWGEPRTRVIYKAAREDLRVVHSHGSWATGTFTPTETAATLTDAPMFATTDPVPVVARFSNFHSEKDRDDDAPGPRGLAVRLLHHEASLDLIVLSLDRFFARTREDFMSFSRAMARRGLVKWIWMLFLVVTGRTRLIVLRRLLRAGKTSSYATLPYHGVNAFCYQRSGADPRPIRLLFEPASDQNDSFAEGTGGSHRLDQELKNRLAAPDSPVVFTVVAVDGTGLAKNRIDDALVKWPRRCKRWTLGTLKLDTYGPGPGPEPDYNPHNLCPGIKPSDDPILMARRAAYPASVNRRLPPGGANAEVGEEV